MSIFLLPVFAGLLHAFSFSGWGSGFGSAIGIALLLIFHGRMVSEDRPKAHLIWSIYLSYILFNVLSCGWIVHASIFGGVSEVLINSLFMLMPWIAFNWAYKIKGRAFAKLLFLVSWLAFEYLHTNWELEWPWLHLGNGFANEPSLIQWYEFTGTAGGTAWVLLLALSMHALYCRFAEQMPRPILLREAFILASLFVVPIIASTVLNTNAGAPLSTRNVLAIQPNFDPYGNDGKGTAQQLSEITELTRNAMTDSTELVLWPEVSIEGGMWENNITERSVFQKVAELTKAFPNADFIVGASTFRFYDTQNQPTPSARYHEMQNGYYDVFNSLLHIRNGELLGIRHKSKLVIGVETIPFPGLMSAVSGFISSLGGSVGSLGTDDTLRPFQLANGAEINSLICYESVFGEYSSSGSPSLISIHTNDGWWGNTQGHKQHFSFARIRAIENRRYVVRSAYCGISGFIAPDGTVLSTLPYETKGSVSAKVALLEGSTFYAENGDFIGRWASFFAIVLLLYLFVQAKVAVK